MVKKGIKELVAEAEAVIETLPAEEAVKLANDENTVFVDIRDIRELYREGRIPGSLHAPRGMLEFWVDPDSPYHKEIFASGKRFVLHSAIGWRSALATKTLHEMGLENICHIGGGYDSWKEHGGNSEPVEQGKKDKK